jgi:hypothetical protein
VVVRVAARWDQVRIWIVIGCLVGALASRAEGDPPRSRGGTDREPRIMIRDLRVFLLAPSPELATRGASEGPHARRTCQPSGPEAATRSCSALEGFVITWSTVETVVAFATPFAPALRKPARRWLAVHGASPSFGANQTGFVAGIAAAF